MTRFRKQGGFVSMISLMIVLMIMGSLLVAYAQRQKTQQIIDNQNSFYHHINYLVTQINTYQSDQYSTGQALSDSQLLFPSSFAELQSKGYLSPCSTAENRNGNCMKPEQTPWGNTIQYQRQKVNHQAYYEAIMTITLPTETPANRFELRTSLSLFSKQSGVTYNATNRTLTIHVPRLENLLALKAIVKRSGQNSTLTGDWDVGGNYSIVNAKDVQIRNADGSQRSLARGVIDSLVVQDSDIIPKPQCPVGLSADLILTPKTIVLPINAVSQKYLHVRTNFDNQIPTQYKVHLSYLYQDSASHWATGNRGSMTAQLVCH